MFYYDYNDFQAFTFSGLQPFVTNEDATVLGVEAELITNPWEGWEFLFGLSALDTELKNYATSGPPGSGLTLIEDRELAAAPEITFNGLARYKWAMFGGTMSIQGDFNYTGEQFFDIANNPSAKEDGYVVGNLRLGYTTADERWNLSLAVKNISDTEYRTFHLAVPAFGGLGQSTYGNPRWVSGTVRYTWQ